MALGTEARFSYIPDEDEVKAYIAKKRNLKES